MHVIIVVLRLYDRAVPDSTDRSQLAEMGGEGMTESVRRWVCQFCELGGAANCFL